MTKTANKTNIVMYDKLILYLSNATLNQETGSRLEPNFVN